MDWLIGSDIDLDWGSVYSADDRESTCPDDATTWEYWDGKAWVPSAEITSTAIGPLAELLSLVN